MNKEGYVWLVTDGGIRRRERLDREEKGEGG